MGISNAYNQRAVTVSYPSNVVELNFQKISQIRAGQFSAALSFERELFVWGRGVFGEFFLPHRVKAASILDIQDFSVSKGGMAVITTKLGYVYTWGDNKFG